MTLLYALNIKNFIALVIIISAVVVVERIINFLFGFGNNVFVSILVLFILLLSVEPFLVFLLPLIIIKEKPVVSFFETKYDKLAEALANSIISSFNNKINKVVCVLKEGNLYRVIVAVGTTCQLSSLREDGILIKLLKFSKEPLYRHRIGEYESVNELVKNFELLGQINVIIPISTKDEFFGLLGVGFSYELTNKEMTSLQRITKEAALCLQDINIYQQKKYTLLSLVSKSITKL